VKVTVIPNAGELLEVLRPYLWNEITDLEVTDLLQVLADCGFTVSHEVEVDDHVLATLERSLASARSLRRGRPERTQP
jgi:uncharacterized protein YihD (DUF1040 family)